MITWKYSNLFTITILFVSAAVTKVYTQTRQCPPQEAILPCRCIVRTDESQIWCSHSNLPKVLEGLKSVGQYIFEPIDELILENNYLPSLPGRTFVPLKVLRLMLRHNRLERVSSDWLAGLESSLMELFVVEPNLRSLPEDSLIQLNDLEAVTIQANELRRLPLFFRLPKLRYLQIESRSLVDLLPRTFQDLPSLEKFHLSGSPRLVKLEESVLEDLPRLKLVNISFTGISWINPRAMSQLPVLKELSLVGNHISDAGMIGRGSRDLPNLEIIRLDYNVIERLGEASFVDMPALKKLYISNNLITELHHGAFHRVPKLKKLNLNHNRLKKVHPESFLQPSGSGLQELWLMDNHISHIRELASLLEALPRLTFLDMSYNNLEEIPFGALRGHPTLERLHLDYNKINFIGGEAFMAMPALRELRLRNNSLSDLLQLPLWNLPALKGLDLSGNLFRRIESNLLLNLPSLKRIDLSQNDIVFIEPSAFLLTPELEHVNLSQNSLVALHPATFRHLLNLYELDLSRNRLLEFAPGLPRGLENLLLSHNKISNIPLPPSPDTDLPSLKILNLSNNEIKSIPKSSLKTMPQLKKLYLSQNFVSNLEKEAFEGLSRLETLEINDNRISFLHPHSFIETMDLEELNLRNNKLDMLVPDLFKNAPHLKKLDVSKNQLAEILPGTLNNIRDLIILDASYNKLVQIPQDVQQMKKLRLLDLTSNRLRVIDPEYLSNLVSLTELKISENFIHDLRKGAFENLSQLKILHLDRNEIDFIEPKSIRMLPSLRQLKLNKNKLKLVPSQAFSNLPLLQVIELQDNEISKIEHDAFHIVPHLLLLNISNNYLSTFEDSGLVNLRSLELLDISNNRISRIEDSSLHKMEWLVELRMDGNHICNIHGSPFNGMPRLRVLSMRNNRLAMISEDVMDNLRGNIAILDIDGNPLSCTCSLLWLRGWLQESSTTGPRCHDGTPVREMRLSRKDCAGENRRVETVVPGCEAELLSSPGKSQVFPKGMKLSANTTGGKIISLAPSPEQSEYFYDEYIDYPYNESAIFESDIPASNGSIKEHKSNLNFDINKSPHYTPGDTPTIYAAIKNKTNQDIPKEVHNSPSTSGFTFFGVPLPSINFNNLWGSNGRRESRPPFIKTNDKHPKPAATVIAERKTAIVNKVAMPMGTSRAHIIQSSLTPPNQPEIQMGGFVPLLPGSGGFTPMLNPIFQTTPETISRNELRSTSEPLPTMHFTSTPKTLHPSMGHPIPSPTFSTSTISSNYGNQNTKDIVVGKNKKTQTVKEILIDTKKESTNIDFKHEKYSIESQASDNKTFTEGVTSTIENEDIQPTEKFEDLFQEVEENSNPISVTTLEPVTSASNQQINNISVSTTPKMVAILKNSNNDFNHKEVLLNSNPALLVPGGQQPQFKSSGRSTITKVPSPYFISATAPLQSNMEIAQISEPLDNTKRESKSVYDQIVTEKDADIAIDDTSWYFANYNKSNTELFVSKGGAPSCRYVLYYFYMQFGIVFFLVN